MLSSDVIIHDLLLKEKEKGNPILQHFHIQYPSKNVAKESNSIFVAVVSSEPSTEMLDSTEYRDLVEILVVTKIRDYMRAVKVIKTVIKEIIRLIKKFDEFDVRPVIRNIAPEYNSDFVLNKGHIMVEILTEIDDELDHETLDKVCKILIEDIDVGWLNMAKKKEEDKKEETNNNYDLNKAINDLEASEQIKKGFEYYINHNTVNIKDNITLKKEFNKFIKGV